MRPSRHLQVINKDRTALERIARAPTSEQRVVLRARIVLLSSDGVATGSICEQLRTTTPTVTRWRDRYEAEGIAGLLKDAQRSGRRATITKQKVAEVIEKTQREKPAGVIMPPEELTFEAYNLQTAAQGLRAAVTAKTTGSNRAVRGRVRRWWDSQRRNGNEEVRIPCWAK